jgi:hypothetical protein
MSIFYHFSQNEKMVNILFELLVIGGKDHSLRCHFFVRDHLKID